MRLSLSLALLSAVFLAACADPLPKVSLSSVSDSVTSLWSHDPGIEAPQKRVDKLIAEGMPARLLVMADTGQCDETHRPRASVFAVSQALQERPGLILVAGDLAYPDGRASDFSQCFDPAMGPIKNRMLAVPGNHEYRTPGAGPYFDYFGAVAGPKNAGWYSVNFARWHIVGLNSNLPMDPGSAQYDWLMKDLKSRPPGCLMAFFHEPRFSSGRNANNKKMDPIWRALADAHADFVIVGDDHHYERFVPLGGDGVPDSKGVRQFIVGTGGAELYAPSSIYAGSEVRAGQSYGLLEIELKDASYTWRFLAVNETDFEDRGSASCHGGR